MMTAAGQAVSVGAMVAAVERAQAGCADKMMMMGAELQHALWMCYEHEAMHLETFM